MKRVPDLSFNAYRYTATDAGYRHATLDPKANFRVLKFNQEVTKGVKSYSKYHKKETVKFPKT